MLHIIQLYGSTGDLHQATIVANLPSAEAAWEYLDALRARMNANEVPLDYVDLLVVDEARSPVARPARTIQ